MTRTWRRRLLAELKERSHIRHGNFFIDCRNKETHYIYIYNTLLCFTSVICTFMVTLIMIILIYSLVVVRCNSLYTDIKNELVCLPCHAHSSCGQCNHLSQCIVSYTPCISTCCSHCLGNWDGLPRHCLLPPPLHFLFHLLPLLSLLPPPHLVLAFSTWGLRSRPRQETRHWAEPLFCLPGLYEWSVWRRDNQSQR